MIDSINPSGTCTPKPQIHHQLNGPLPIIHNPILQRNKSINLHHNLDPCNPNNTQGLPPKQGFFPPYFILTLLLPNEPFTPNYQDPPTCCLVTNGFRVAEILFYLEKKTILCDGILHVNMFHYFKIPYNICTFFSNFIYNEYTGP